MVLDPLSALSLAGNVVQFIEFSSSILSESRKIYQSGAGTSENIVLESVADDLRRFSVRLKLGLPENDQDELSKFDKGLYKILESCEEVTNELLQAVQGLKLEEGPRRKWNSFRQALASVWRKEKLLEMQSRLSFVREQITLHIVSSIRGKQDEVIGTLRRLQAESKSMEVDQDQELKNISASLEVIRISHASMPTKNDLDQIRHVLEESSSAAADISKTIEILQSLRYESMSLRHSRIVEAHSKTFNWVFNTEKLPQSDVRSRIGFQKWLLAKDGIFWISGKPGSGKSTLMKYISDDPRTTASLQRWAGTSKLSKASFYFWNSGTDMQKSQQGLLQSLLFEILSQCPDILPEVCQPKWEANKFQRSRSWTPAELNTAFEHIQGRASTTRKFCFFIDGLDEYEGDHFELLDTMVNIVKSPHIKLCLSSRPWNCFEDVLGREFDRKLYLQDLTREDIEIYAGAKLKRPIKWTWTHEDHAQHQALTLDIVGRAQGVFLWVYLVVRSLQEGLANGDSISMLQTRLRTLPTDLEAYFEHILRSVDNFYEEKLGCMFQVALLAEQPLYVLIYSFLDEDDPDFSIKLAPGSITTAEIHSRQSEMQRRISGRSKGLLEVVKDNPGGTSYSLGHVEFLHRTVRDFLTTKRMQSFLDGITPGIYNAAAALSRGFLAFLKTSLYCRETNSVATRDIHIIQDEVVKFARIAEDQRGISDIPVLRELERVSKARFQMFLESPTSFLEYAIEEGLVVYVKDTLNEQPQLLSLNGGMLLHSALGKGDIASRDCGNANLIPMLRMLLERGINPNSPVKGSTVWKRFLKSYQPGWESKVHRDWRSVLKLLLLWGADRQEAFGLLELIMNRSFKSFNDNVRDNSVEPVRTLELLLSLGLDPNQPLPQGGTLWTQFLETVCPEAIFWNAVIINGIARTFLRYGADPLTTYCHDLDYSSEIRPVSEGVIKCIAPTQDQQHPTLQSLLEEEIAYFKSRDRCTKKRKRSQSPESRKRQHFHIH